MSRTNAKADEGDICESGGWYDDEYCDDFCEHPDPACVGACTQVADCAPILCSGDDCPITICLDGACMVDDPRDGCEAGERECPTCGGESVCSPFAAACPAVTCEAPMLCDAGEHPCRTCGFDYVCAPDGAECPAVGCGPCGEGEIECASCDGGRMCVEQSEGCPACLCDDTCHYAGDGECDDGGPGSQYSVCDLGTDCTDCGAR